MASREAHPRVSKSAVRWRWVNGCVSLGILLLAGSWFAEARWGWTGVTPSVLVNLGTTLLLAAGLFFVERLFLREVATTSERAVEVAASRISDDFERRVEGIGTRLDDLDSALAARSSERSRVQDDSATVLSDRPSYWNVRKVFTEANDIGALTGGALTVPVSTDLDGVTVTFSLSADEHQIRPVLMVRVNLEPGPEGRIPVVELEWDAHISAVDVGEDLARQLQRQNRWSGSQTLPWGKTIEHLQGGLLLAMRSRRREVDSPHLADSLTEILVPDRWYLTRSSLECPALGVVIEQSMFPSAQSAGIGRRRPSNEELLALRPAIVESSEWLSVARKASRYFPYSLGGLSGRFMSSGPTPWSSDHDVEDRLLDL